LSCVCSADGLNTAVIALVIRFTNEVASAGLVCASTHGMKYLLSPSPSSSSGAMMWRYSKSFTSRDGVRSCSELPLILSKVAKGENTLLLKIFSNGWVNFVKSEGLNHEFSIHVEEYLGSTITIFWRSSRPSPWK